jgi:hypothetical protein
MTIRFDGPTEAFAAVATTVVATDKLGTMDERDFLFEQVKNLDLFKGYDKAEFTKLLSDTTDKVYGTLPTDGTSITKQGVESLVEAVKEVLDPEMRVEVFRMAIGLVRSDKSSDEERTLLGQLQRGLEIDDGVAQDILGG